MTTATEPTYFKCAECHLLIEPNAAFDDDPDNLAPWVHLMGDCVFCVATDQSHEARPDTSIGVKTLSYWAEHGPLFMRMRFEGEYEQAHLTPGRFSRHDLAIWLDNDGWVR